MKNKFKPISISLSPNVEKDDVLLALNYLMSEKRQEFMLAFPKYDPSKHKAASGSFWMQRKLA